MPPGQKVLFRAHPPGDKQHTPTAELDLSPRGVCKPVNDPACQRDTACMDSYCRKIVHVTDIGGYLRDEIVKDRSDLGGVHHRLTGTQ